MSESDIKELVYKYGLVPVVAVDTREHAVPLAKALCDSKLEIAEVTFRTECAAEAIADMTAAYPDMLVGAGTVLSVEQAQKALDAGAKFIVTPGFDERIVKFCQEKGIVVIPGCATPSDVQKAVACGLDVVNFFPAEAEGGLKMINSLASVYKGVRFLPTGGITPEKFSEYLLNPNVIAVGASCVTPRKLVEAGDFEGIRKLARDAVFAVLNFQFCHMGINCYSDEEGYKNLFALADMFNLVMGDTPSSSYVGREVEITKVPFKVRGPHGHLGYYTDNLERAVFYLEKKGVEFDHEHVKPYKGKMYVIYLKEQIAGFAVHIEERNDHNPPAWEHRDVIKARIGWKD